MEKGKVAEVKIKGLNKMTKAEVRSLATWIEQRAKKLRIASSVGQPWLVKRRNYAPKFRFSLFR